MLKKFFLFFTIAIALLLFTNFSFATDDFNSGVDNLGNDIKQTVDKTRETIGNIEQGAENAVGNMGEKVNEMMHSGDNNKEQDNSGYSAARTATTRSATGITNTNATTWVWIVLAVVGIIIVALTWYYASEKNTNR